MVIVNRHFVSPDLKVVSAGKEADWLYLINKMQCNLQET